MTLLKKSLPVRRKIAIIDAVSLNQIKSNATGATGVGRGWYQSSKTIPSAKNLSHSSEHSKASEKFSRPDKKILDNILNDRQGEEKVNRVRFNKAKRKMPLREGIFARGKEIDGRHVASILEKRLMRQFASEEFIFDALQKNTGVVLAYMNSWSHETMNDFIDCYSGLVESMLGKLFACGLSVDQIPVDIMLSSLFLRVAMNENPERLMAEIIEKNNTCDIRQALANLSPAEIKKLWDHGMSTNKIPSHKFLEVSHLLENSERFRREISRPINQTFSKLLRESPNFDEIQYSPDVLLEGRTTQLKT
ncbi:MAG: hypothetical protein LBI56_02285 [Puniceicoccales bacterium]|nr:hypothetical protein [Puniceicoccales bacterium]